MPVRVKVQPSNTPDKPPSLLSSSAKKILDSLQSSGSPLKDARRLPMRQLSDDDLVKDGHTHAYFCDHQCSGWSVHVVLVASNRSEF